MPWPKARWGLGLRSEIEGVGVGEAAGVAVGGAQGDDHRVAGRDARTVQIVVLGEEAPGGEFEGAVVAEEFLDGARQERRVRAQPGQLVRVAEEGDQSGGDLVGDRFLARHEELEDHGVQLFLGQFSAVAGGHQTAEQVVVPVFALVGDDVGDVALEAVQAGLVKGACGVGGADRLHDLAPVAVEAGGQLLREADGFGEDLEGEVGREAGDEVRGTGLGQGVDQRVGQFLETGAELFDAARGEGVGDEARACGCVPAGPGGGGGPGAGSAAARA